MTDEPRGSARPCESEEAFADDLLVEAARSGRLRGDPSDPLAQALAALHERARVSCPCGSRDPCGDHGCS
ncbi:hypothetical protein [Pseudonocardia abyssalis]|uniref:Uncharacterized protein n=1 Tax=Pseudonocardia abyssalis TaxID=2792008 RepID=A0ABS6V1V2_9PSEU|nr:hypothetical protein [Pseudonocardia abyssalis]MBW0114207.1 hypothetical protein [Pseudonocardia abyssalis]MBW0138488.1 hypothetical protein [Pseudonocardia abyssalis]